VFVVVFYGEHPKGHTEFQTSMLQSRTLVLVGTSMSLKYTLDAVNAFLRRESHPRLIIVDHEPESVWMRIMRNHTGLAKVELIKCDFRIGMP
jgi:hypothetical protein